MAEPAAPRVPVAPVAIVTGGNEAYAPGLVALGRSVIRHRPPGRPLDFYVVDGGLTRATRTGIEASWADAGVSVHWLHLDAAVLAHAGVTVDGKTVPRCVTLALDLLLPAEATRVLCLDADTLVLSDLTPLWDADLAGCTLGAVRDTMIHTIRDTWMPAEMAPIATRPNFNAGVMLVDLKRWRAEQVGSRARDLLQRYQDRMWSVDQQVLNWTLVDRWKPLPLAWNRMSHVRTIPSWRGTCFGQADFEEAVNAPRIVHFTGRSKPWHARCRDDRTSAFVEMMQHTAWAPWTPPAQGLVTRLVDDLVREPRARCRYVQRGLGLARRNGLPRGPWYRSAAGLALRYPWTIPGLVGPSIASRLRRWF